MPDVAPDQQPVEQTDGQTVIASLGDDFTPLGHNTLDRGISYVDEQIHNCCKVL